MKQAPITYVTGLWNLNREGRDFDEWYLPALLQLLEIDVPFYIYGDPELEEHIWKVRDKENTVFYPMPVEEFKTYFGPHWEMTQAIRQDPEWVKQGAWMPGCPQHALEYYNPIVMSKLPMVNDVSIRNPFQSQYFYWIDAGLTRTVDYNLLNSGVLDRTAREPFTFLSYPHHVDNEIHGFEREAIAKYCGVDFVDYVCRGGFFGGNRFMIRLLNGMYYDLCQSTLRAGYMGTEESVFTILAHQHPDLLGRFNLGGGGITPYFEFLKDERSVNRVNLYILTYNTPKQVEALLEDMRRYDEKFLTDPNLILVDNSDDPDLEAEYQVLTETYKLTRIKKDNLGITGGRHFIAEHFEESEADLCIYFEDDMMFYDGPPEGFDSGGFRRQIKDLYETVVAVCRFEKFDFLKFNFEEVFANNTTNTAWHNMSEEARKKAWPNLQGGPPLTKFNNIKTMNEVSYADGDVFYANWPHVMSKPGSKKVFLENRYLNPSEWSVMAHAYECWMEGNLKPGVLLASPIQHKRLHDYDRTKRKEF